MTLYRRKPILVHAIQWDGRQIPGLILKLTTENWDKQIAPNFVPRYGGTKYARAAIPTNQGFIAVCYGDFLIHAPSGEVHAQPPEIFFRHYEEVNQAKLEGTEAVQAALYDGLYQGKAEA